MPGSGASARQPPTHLWRRVSHPPHTPLAVDGVTTHTLTAGAATRFAQSPEQRDRLRRELPTLVRFGQMINAVDTEGVASAWTPIEPTHRLRVRPDRTPGASSSRRASQQERGLPVRCSGHDSLTSETGGGRFADGGETAEARCRGDDDDEGEGGSADAGRAETTMRILQSVPQQAGAVGAACVLSAAPHASPPYFTAPKVVAASSANTAASEKANSP